MPPNPPFSDAPDSGSTSAAGGRLVGSNNLQQAVDGLASAVGKLDSFYTKITSTPNIAGTHTGNFPRGNPGWSSNVGAAGGFAGAPTAAPSSPAAPGVWGGGVSGGFGSPPGGAPSPPPPSFPRANQGYTIPRGSYMGGPPPSGTYGSSGGPGAGIQATAPGGTPQGTYGSGNTGRPGYLPQSTSPAGNPRANQGYTMPTASGYGYPGGLPQPKYGSGGGVPGTPGGPPLAGGGPPPASANTGWSMGGVAAGGAAAGGALLGYGAANLSSQISMSNYIQRGTLMAPQGMSNGAASQVLRNQAFGTGGNNLNAIALNQADAAAGATNLMWMSGTMNPSSTGYGRSLTGATNFLGYSNPGMGMLGASNAANSLYNPQTSMQMRALGYPTTPMTAGVPGGAASFPSLMSGIMSTWFGKSSVSQNTLSANLAPGQAGYVNLQAMGLSAGSIQSLTPAMEAYNRMSQAGLTNNKISTLMTQASKNNKGAQQTLSKYGVTTSDQQMMQNYQSVLTGQSGDTMGGFSSGLQAATTAIGSFQNAITKFLDATGMNNAAGFAGGAGAGTGAAMKNNIFSGLGLGAGIGGGMSLIGRLIGGGAARGGTAAATTNGASAVARAAGAAGSAGGDALGSLGPLVSMLAPLISSGGRSNVAKVAGQANPMYGGKWNPLNWVAGSAAGALNSLSFGHVNMYGYGSTNTQGGGAGNVASTGQSNPGTSVKTANASSVPQQAVTAVHAAEQQIGLPYIWGGETPGRGFDCSGLIQWAYGQAGVRIPRTSQAQWSALSKRSVPLNRVQEGDIVFAAGSDGTAASPGHEAMLVNNNTIVEAATTGTNIRMRAYNAGEWQHAARPNGSLAGGAAGGATGGSTATTASFGIGMSGISGNSGIGFSEGASLSSASESSMLGGGGGVGIGSMGAASVNTSTAASASGSGSNASAPSNPTAAQAQSVAKGLAQSYGWSSGTQWKDLVSLWQRESSWMWNATNPTSGAYGIPQSLPANKMASAGSDWKTNAGTQIKWGLGYIKSTYGSPASAWATENRIGSYADGGPVTTPLSLVGEKGPEVLTTSDTAKILRNVASGKSNGSGMPPVNINFGNGAIQISGTGSSSDLGSSARQAGTEILKMLSSENIYEAIQNGRKN